MVNVGVQRAGIHFGPAVTVELPGDFNGALFEVLQSTRGRPILCSCSSGVEIVWQLGDVSDS